VYDAVADRVNYEGLKPTRPELREDRALRSMRAVPPDEVLGRRINAPKDRIPYEEPDELPNSDLLTAIHQYASDFYDRNGMGEYGHKMLDETALLALGVLVEEQVRGALGEKGHLAFIETERAKKEDGEEHHLAIVKEEYVTGDS